MNTSSWLQYDLSTNKLSSTYLLGFLDISGNIVLRNGGINITNNDISLNGNISISCDCSMTGNVILSNAIQFIDDSMMVLKNTPPHAISNISIQNYGTIRTSGISIGTGPGTNPYHNTRCGYQTLNVNTTGNYNTAVGLIALNANTTGSYNTALSVNASSTATITNSVIVGYNTSTTGSYNTVIGEVTSISGTNSSILGTNTSFTKSNTILLGWRGTTTTEQVDMYQIYLDLDATCFQKIQLIFQPSLE